MVKVTFEINGKSYSPERGVGALEGAIYATVSESIQAKIGEARCSAHGEPPGVKVIGTGLKDLRFEISSCCPDFETTLGKVLAEEP